MFRTSLLGRALVGVTFLSVITLAVSLLVLQSQGAFRSTVDVTGKFQSVGDGLPVGSDVKLRGVIVGRVSEVNAAPGEFDVHMELKPEFVEEIPASVQASILPTNLFGAPFVDLRVAGGTSPSISDGAEIPEDLSIGSVQMQSVFQKVYDVLVAIEPAKLNITLTAIADAMRGNGDRIGRMIEHADTYVSGLNANTEVFRDDLTLLAEALDGVDQAAPDLLASLSDITTVAKEIVRDREGLQRLFVAGIRTADTVTGFIDDHGSRIIRFLDVSGRFFDILAANAPFIRLSLVGLADAAARLGSLAPDKGGIRLIGHLITDPFPHYTSADCPRYGSLAGANCGRASRSAASPSPTSTYGGDVGPVGSPEESREIARLTGRRDSADALTTLLLGPVVRGGTVVLR